MVGVGVALVRRRRRSWQLAAWRAQRGHGLMMLGTLGHHRLRRIHWVITRALAAMPIRTPTALPQGAWDQRRSSAAPR